MKTINLLIALLICGAAHAQVTMHIHYSNGTVLDIEGTDIDSVYYPLNPMNHAVYLTNDDVQSDPMMLIDSVTFSGAPQVPMSCLDGIQNNGEFAPDCGGPCPPCGTCDDGIQNEVWVPLYNDFFMEQGIDCGFPCPNYCAPTCEDGIQNGNETGIDCGGSCPEDCPPATCFDNVWNGEETGVDCGGPDCPPCSPGNCVDGIQNQNEEGIDCGGVCPVACPEATCFDGIQNGMEEGIDCGGNCPVICPPESCNDGVQNQGEEWIDCGGPCPNICPTCDDGVQNGPEIDVDCVVGDDPDYYGGMCPQCPSCFDGIQNGWEISVDCGCPNCPDCVFYLSAANLNGTVFIGEDFEIISTDEGGFSYHFTASQTIGGESHTLMLSVPMDLEDGQSANIQSFPTTPSAVYTDFNGDVYESEPSTNSEMSIFLWNVVPECGPGRVEGYINTMVLVNEDNNESITIQEVDFGLNTY